jgi:hypothetical protein
MRHPPPERSRAGHPGKGRATRDLVRLNDALPRGIGLSHDATDRAVWPGRERA